MQQVERNPWQIPLPSVLPLQPQMPTDMPGENKASIKQFVFVGNKKIVEVDLQPLVAPYLNRPLSFGELQNAATDVANYYRQMGWIATVVLPAQDITDGIVTIQVIEAAFGGMIIEKQLSRVSPDRIQKTIQAAMTDSAPLLTELDRGLAIVNDLPGTKVHASMQKGKGENEVQVHLKMMNEPLVQSRLFMDNSGSRSTGTYRLGGAVNLNSINGWGDQAAVNTIHSEGMDYARLKYVFPVGYSGLRLGANASFLKYKFVSPEFVAADGHGDFNTFGLEASYPLIRSSSKNLILLGGVEKKRFKNDNGDVNTSKYESDVATLGFAASMYDGFAHGGTNNIALTFTGGNLDFSGSPNQPADAMSTSTGGQFAKAHYFLSSLRPITENLLLYAVLQGQKSNKNLDSSEKFYLGGESGVRAYPTSEGGGSEGLLVNLQLSRRLPNNCRLIGFYDWGQVTLNKFQNSAQNNPINTYALKGWGVGLEWSGPYGIEIKSALARRIGDNPNPSSTGMDQDGTKRVNRFWLNISVAL